MTATCTMAVGCLVSPHVSLQGWVLHIRLRKHPAVDDVLQNALLHGARAALAMRRPAPALQPAKCALNLAHHQGHKLVRPAEKKLSRSASDGNLWDALLCIHLAAFADHLISLFNSGINQRDLQNGSMYYPRAACLLKAPCRGSLRCTDIHPIVYAVKQQFPAGCKIHQAWWAVRSFHIAKEALKEDLCFRQARKRSPQSAEEGLVGMPAT